MRKIPILIFILGLVLTNGIPLTIGIPLRNTQQVNSSGEESYNLNVDIDADRHVSPHSYGEGVEASFIIWVRNEGQNESNVCNVTCSITRLFVAGFFNFDRELKEMQHIEWTEKPFGPRAGHGTIVSFGCPITNGFFAIYKIQARIDAKDSNSGDNSDSFLFFVVWVGWWDRWIDIID
jgi:hypothetical protein